MLFPYVTAGVMMTKAEELIYAFMHGDGVRFLPGTRIYKFQDNRVFFRFADDKMIESYYSPLYVNTLLVNNPYEWEVV